MSNESQRVLLLGASGLVGRQCVQKLARDPRVSAVVCPVRTPVAGEWSPRVEFVAADFERIAAWPAALFAIDAVLCALGSTIRQAGSQTAFVRIDHGIVLEVARRARDAGVARFGLVSALGADPQSRVFYNRVKGEAERDLATLGFDTLVIARPSLLLGDRREFRLAERCMQPFARLLPPRWRAVHARQVASALVEATLRGRHGVQLLENEALLRQP